MNSADYMTTYYLGLIYEKIGNYRNTIFYLIDTIEKNSTFEKAYIKLGEIFLVKNEFEKAHKYLMKVYSMNPYNSDTLNNLGLCCLNMGDETRAI